MHFFNLHKHLFVKIGGGGAGAVSSGIRLSPPEAESVAAPEL